MKTAAFPIALLISLAMFVGCAPTARRDTDPIPPATISSAAFKTAEQPTILITGEFFKMKSDNKKDVIVSLNGRNWSPAISISESSPTAYIAVVPFSIAFPQVWVRVFGMNGEYSSPYLIQGVVR